MKTIHVLRNTGNHLPRFTEGQVVEVSDQVAELLEGIGVAEPLRAVPNEPLKAIPETPSIVAAETFVVNETDNQEPTRSAPKHKRQRKTKPDSKE